VKANSWGKRRTDSAKAALAALALACGKAATPPAGAPPGSWGPGVASGGVLSRVDFAFDSLDERPVSAEATRGKPTILTFVTTSSLSAQAQVDFLVAMSKHDGDRVNYAVVALERRDDRELVELYKKGLSIPFPVAIADVQTLAGGGAFGDISAVPVTVMLDRLGRVVWRIDGRVAKSGELRAALRGL
jgi:hypothetical protein